MHLLVFQKMESEIVQLYSFIYNSLILLWNLAKLATATYLPINILQAYDFKVTTLISS